MNLDCKSFDKSGDFQPVFRLGLRRWALVRLVGVILFTPSLLGVSTVGFSKAVVTEWEKSLNFVELQINSRPVQIKNGQTLHVVNGDQLKIIDGYLNQAGKKPLNVNFIGFNNSGVNRAGEDRGILIPMTRAGVLYGWATGPDRNRFKIVADTGGSRHGQVYIEITEPRLNYAQIKVNGTTSVYRNGDEIFLKNTDKWQVLSVKTNVSDNKLVEYKIHDLGKKSAKSKYYRFHLVFSRGKKSFARLSINVEGL